MSTRVAGDDVIACVMKQCIHTLNFLGGDLGITSSGVEVVATGTGDGQSEVEGKTRLGRRGSHCGCLIAIEVVCRWVLSKLEDDANMRNGYIVLLMGKLMKVSK